MFKKRTDIYIYIYIYIYIEREREREEEEGLVNKEMHSPSPFVYDSR